MRILLFIMSITFIGFNSCKSPSQAMGTDSIVASNSGSKASNLNNDKVYDLIISFTSIGAGIDYKLKEKIDNKIESFNTENKTNILPEKNGWGREGEVDYLFDFKNLSTSQKKSFIALINETIGSSELTFLYFDKKAVHKR